MPARFAAFVVEQSVAFLRATPETDCLSRPSPGTVSVVEIVIELFVVRIVDFLVVNALLGAENVALTARASVIVNVQVVVVPLQEPVQPVKVEPAEATAVNVTDW